MLFLALLLAFFIGAIPFGVLIGKSRGVDVRSVGSGNIGATNVWRALGPQAGTAAFVLDVLKGVAGPFIGRALVPGSEIGIALCAIAPVLGHTFSPFLGFKGGKGISTSLGGLFGLIPWVGIVIFAIWGVVLAFTRTISLASVVACVLLPFLALGMGAPWPSVAVAGLMGLVAFLKHIPNLKRIKAGVEPKIGQKKSARKNRQKNRRRPDKWDATAFVGRNACGERESLRFNATSQKDKVASPRSGLRSPQALRPTKAVASYFLLQVAANSI